MKYILIEMVWCQALVVRVEYCMVLSLPYLEQVYVCRFQRTGICLLIVQLWMPAMSMVESSLKILGESGLNVLNQKGHDESGVAR